MRYRANSRSGAAIIEFAIVANVLFLMIFLCLEFARINMVRNLAQDAAYFAARVAVVPGATAAEAEAIAHTLMSTMVDSGYTVVAAEINDDTTEAVVTVSVDVDHVAFFGSKFLPNTEIVATARMRTERFTGFFKPST
ncbi:MAG: TadE family protein [Planctomycetota bacterium]